MWSMVRRSTRPDRTVVASASAAARIVESSSENVRTVLPPRSTNTTGRPSNRTTRAPGLRPGRWPSADGQLHQGGSIRIRRIAGGQHHRLWSLLALIVVGVRTQFVDGGGLANCAPPRPST